MTWLRRATFLLLSCALGAGAGCSDDGGGSTPRPDASTAPDAGSGPDADTTPDATQVAFANAEAHWVGESVIAVPTGLAGDTFELHHAADAGIGIDFMAGTVSGSQVVALTEDTNGLPQTVTDKFPHLSGYKALTLPAGIDTAAILQSQLAVVGKSSSGLVSATAVQIPGVLDELFAYDGALGVGFEDTGAPQRPTFRLWAPTARSVTVHVYNPDKTDLDTQAMTQNVDNPAVWEYTATDASWYGNPYLYEVEVFTYRDPANPGSDTDVPGGVVKNLVTDPYSVALTTNSEYSLIIDLGDAATKPPGWDAFDPPSNFQAPEDIVLYEVHVRDFSIDDQSVTDAADRGKYTAFTYDGANDADDHVLSDGMAHLQRLAHPDSDNATIQGVTHVHLLPVFDIATIDEDATARVDLDSNFSALCARTNNVVPAGDCTADANKSIRTVLDELLTASGTGGTLGDTEEIQALVDVVRGLDGYNWGYDPFHYTTPEGSYATDPEGVQRIIEFRQMVMGLGAIDLRVVMDVVYNHTNASGQSDRSVLDKIVPGYYHRQNQTTGDVERSTCCENTATEHAMMEKLMIDSLEVWASQYKVSGFRFDLMGHHMKSNMENVRTALDSIDPDIYIYGEGWDFGEVGGNARGVNATQPNLAGTGIGTFSDRLRDAVRGGGPFDNGDALRVNQGFVNGMFYDKNDKNMASDADQLTSLLSQADLIRVGMAGNLKSFVIPSRFDLDIAGEDISYNGYDAGYCEDPQEVITYIAAHDNQTLFDNNQYKIPTGTSMADRVRIQNLGLSINLLGQGIPFLHMGQDILRSKSMTRDSYDYGDWYNRVDFSYVDNAQASNNWNVGLPTKEKDGDAYAVIREIITDTSIQPAAANMERSHDHVREMLTIRRSSPLFSLRTGDEVNTRVDFHNGGSHDLTDGSGQIPGFLVMSITDGTCAGVDLDGAIDNIVILVNARPQVVTFDATSTRLGGRSWDLSRVLETESTDPVVGNSTYNATTNVFSIPARTTAVFFEIEQGARDAGICNTRVGQPPPVPPLPTPPAGADAFLQGNFSDPQWSALDTYKFTRTGDTNFELTATLSAGNYEFKVADDGFSAINIGAAAGGTTLSPGGSVSLATPGSNIGLEIATNGSYTFKLDTSTSQLTLE
ncbi:pullulanase-type alpha-1,6-glucosidase [Haliangium sp.]|uniref:pullulanase-type alpha-1,6-glucosidase n=1 Tax=Haliangium sp. TaxID=2663208 RepID=UPI003D12D640